MNEDDSDQMASLLMQMGYTLTKDLQETDIILLNTCSVRDKPEHKVSTMLGQLRELKQARPELIIGVCGCMAQRQGEMIRRKAPHVDLVIGTAQIERIPELICDVVRSRHPLSALQLPRGIEDEAKVPTRAAQSRKGRLKAFVPVTYGCDNFCAYCIVPYVRGKERSRPMTDIVDEVTRLTDHGCKEVTLLGQNVNSYRNPNASDEGFAELLAALNDVDGLLRIRFMTSHPKDLSDRLIDAIASFDKVCKHIHLPIQAGDNEILRRMRRGYTVEHYTERVNTLRKAVPSIAITTDILVGFPGETDEQFENTMHTIETVRFDAAFMFAYNAIAKTAAASMPDQVPAQVKNERLRRVIEYQNRMTIEINTERLGQVFGVLIEGPSPKDPNRSTGLTTQNKTVNIKASSLTSGAVVDVRMTEAHLYGFVGETTGDY